MEIKAAIEALGALAQETRLAAFRALVEAGPEGLPAGAIATALDVPPATLSFHLKELKQAGVVGCEREGRSLVYRADFDAIRALLRFLTENCCRGPERVPEPH
jgi:DNA-binding transcriptional ArsR family regulator